VSEHTYKKIELTGSSKQGIDAAISNAIAKASETVSHLDWFEVTDIRGNIQNGEVAYWQVTMKVGFRLDS
jgi:hypothetical protein